MTTREEAKRQFLSWYEDVRPGFTTDSYEAQSGEIDREFEDWWKNASADSGMLQGDIYQKTWDELAPYIRERIYRRLAEGNQPGTVIEDTQSLPGAQTPPQPMGPIEDETAIIYAQQRTSTPTGQPLQPLGGDASPWTPQPVGGSFGPSPFATSAGGSMSLLSLQTLSGGINWLLILAIAAGVWLLTRKRS